MSKGFIRIPDFNFAPSSLVELLRWRASNQAGRVSHTFVREGEESRSLTYGEFDERVRAVAAFLQAEGAQGSRALLLYPAGLDYLVAFFGCLYAGVTAVPAYPPRQNRMATRLAAIAADADAELALTTSQILSRPQVSSAVPGLERLRWLATDGVPRGLAREWREVGASRDETAYLQYTSGSTSTPKGVMVSHGNVLHNSAYIHSGFGHTAESVSLTWLPHFHDMGLVDGIIQPLYGGLHGILMSPASFLQRPLNWLEAITRYGVTHSGGPNSAYELCVRRVGTEQRERLDLSSWAVAYTGAEPIRAETLERFAEHFAPCGLRRESIFPAYGLAEATLKVAGGERGGAFVVMHVDEEALGRNRVVRRPAGDPRTRALAGSGRVKMGTRVIVVNPETGLRAAPDEVGEIWVSGPSVAGGYWRREAETAETFKAQTSETGEGPFLRTGDLGFFDEDGELFITGRLKDLIIIRGRNLYPQDVELTAENSHPALRAGGAAAFAVEAGGEERLVVVQEVEHRRAQEAALALGEIRRRVAEEHEAAAYALVLIKPGTLPKTSSGKVQRRACRAMFLAGELEVVAEWREAGVTDEPQVSSGDEARDPNYVREWLASRVASRLGVESREVDAEEPLARLGVDSLLATELIHAVELQFGVRIPFSTLLDEATVGGLASMIAERGGRGADDDAVADSQGDMPESGHALSRGQQALWFLHQLAPESAAYNIARALRIESEVDVDLFRRSWLRMVERHALLRATFAPVNGSPVQRVAAEAGLCFRHEDARRWDEDELRRRMDEAAHEPFNLETDTPLRVSLFTRGEREHVLVLSLHHIVTDFWSLAVLLEEWAATYDALLRGGEPNLRPLRSRYADYVERQEGWLRGVEAERQWEYWRERLGGALPALNLLTDRPRPLTKTYQGATRHFVFGRELSQALKSLAQSEGVTLYMLLLGTFQLLLHRYAGQEEILVGSATAGRGPARFADVFGYFVNPVVLRERFDPSMTFLKLLGQVRRTVLGAFGHEDFPLPLLVDRLHPQRDASRSPLFDVMFNWQHGRHSQGAGALSQLALGVAGARTTLGSLPVESLALPQRVAQFDLTLNVAESDGGLLGALEYNTDLFDAATVARMAEHFTRLLASTTADPSARVSELPLMGEDERRLVLEVFNETAREYPREATLHGLFEHQAARTPDAVAVEYEDERLTYAELNERADRVARSLRRMGVGAESRVGVLLERSINLVVGLLGVLKAGAAYVPLDPEYPHERLRFMLEDSGAEVLLTERRLLERMSEHGARVVLVDEGWDEEGVASHGRAGVSGGNLAYVIYTSGSTGRPKGAMNTHAGVCNRLLWMQETYRLATDDRVMHKTPFSFDVSVWEFFWPLTAGARLVVARPGGHRDAAYLVNLIDRAKITTLHFVPSMLQAFLDEKSLERCASLRRVICSGEELTAELQRRFFSRLDTGLHNLYGPTEAAIDVTSFECERGSLRRTVPIGRPVSNTEIYVLDSSLNPLPVGVPGELYIGGVQLARGYLNRPGLTAERFVPHPFSSDPGARLYRTGDLARHLPDGHIEYLGRLDQQVKLRGFRIELGEIESALRQHEGVREAAVVVRDEAGDKRLVAYVVGDPSPDDAQLRQTLKARLPEYMIPSAFVMLDSLPLTPNGKIDRKALPAPEITGSESHYVAPRTPVEELIAGVWSEVLGVKRVGINDNFFDLGGHSLLLTRVASRLREAYAVELPLRALFESPTVEGLAGAVERALGGAKAVADAPPPLSRVSRVEGGHLPLSYAQQRMWFLSRLEPDSPFYNVAGAVRLRGSLDAEALGRALREVVRRHEALRTRVVEESGEAWQEVTGGEGFEVEIEELSCLSAQAREERVRDAAEADARRPFDLEAGPVWRARLLRLSEDEHVLLLSMHHIVSDGWSLGVLLREVGLLYGAFREGGESTLAEPPVQYADYAVWQREWLEGERLERQLAYWRERLAGAPPALELPTDRPRPAAQSFRGAQHRVLLPRELRSGLQELSGRENATLFMTLLAAFKLLLHRYSRQEEIIVGSPIAGRTRREIEGLIGFFVNTLVLRTEVSDELTFGQLLARVREVCLGAYAHQDVPFEKLLEELRPVRSLSRSPLFQVMFVLQNEGLESVRWPGVELNPVATETGTAKFDLTLSMTDSADGLLTTLEYNTDLFDARTTRLMLEHFRVLLEGIIADPARRVSRLPLLTEGERRRLLVEWSGAADADGVKDERCVHELFEEQAARTPEALAVVFQEKRLTYQELNRRANLLARELRRRGVGPDVPVALLLERSTSMLTAVLGVWKAGGAYVPLDATSPRERLAFMLREAMPPVLLTQEHLLPALPEHDAAVMCLDDADDAWPHDEEGARNLAGAARPSNLAYVIYTSGSTGKPKGVMVQHASVTNLTAALRKRIYARHSSALRVGMNAPLIFDGSVKQIVQLLSGHTLHVLPDELRRDAVGMLAYVRDERLQTLDITPSQLRVLMAEGLGRRHDSAEGVEAEGASAAYPEFMLVGGEAVDEKTRSLLVGAGPRFYNVYGPTESTVDTTACEIGQTHPAATIGRPLSNVETYVLDGELTPVPVGVAGELYVGGEGLARGYLNRPDLTAERFVPHPFGVRAGARLYRTGDLVRHLSDGRIEYLGRLDQQVKLRGFRIELGEIESALKRDAAVRDCAVVVREDTPDEKRITAYVVADGPLTPNQLRSRLRESLPEYMIPSAFVFIEALPLTPNGKLNREALPAPDVSTSGNDFIAPRTPVEELIAGVWSEVLGVERVGVNDNFFDLGGHSLLATRVASRLREAFGIELPLRALFESPTVEGLASHVERVLHDTEATTPPPHLTRVSRSAGMRLPLSYAQQRMWFLSRLEPDSPFYNVAGAVRLRGSLDAEALGRALREVVRRHEALRTRVVEEGGEAWQEVTEGEGFEVEIEELSCLSAQAREERVRDAAEADARRGFDLGAGVLLRARLLRLSEDEHVLLLSMHHIASDGWSIGVLSKELSELYSAYVQGRESTLAELPIQYADYASWQRDRLTADALESQLSYWRVQLAGATPALELPTDRPRPPVQTYSGSSHTLSLPADLTEALRGLARVHDSTLFMLLLAAFQSLLARYTGQGDICVGTPVAGRTRPELEGLIGFFVNTLVLRAELSDDPSFVELLGRVREACLGAYAHQDVPFEKLVEELRPQRDMSRQPLFQVMLAMQEWRGGELRLAGMDVEAIEGEGVTAKFDLTLSLREAGGGFGGWFEYNSDLFDAATIERMAEHFKRLLEGVVADASARVSELPLMSEEEGRLVVGGFNETAREYPREATVHGLFEHQAARTPDAVAVEYEGGKVSYRELNERAERIASRLGAEGVGLESRVGVLLERTPEMVAALLGVLKAGAAYVPLDPEYPHERLRFMLEDSGAEVLVTERRLLERVSEHGARVVLVDEWTEGEEASAPRAWVTAENLAYVIYTSGSTGKPKGVQVTHRGVVRLVRGVGYAELDERQVILQAAPPAFDASTFELWGALLNGGRCVLLDERVPTARTLAEVIGRHGVRTMWLTSALFNSVMDEDGGALRGVEQLLVGGEALSVRHVRRALSELKGTRLVNGYGPTESTTFTCCYDIGEVPEGAQTIPIGHPISNTEVYVLDGRMRPVPFGVKGELYIGGDGLARGYINRPGLTAERFVPHPFSPGPGARLYRTGDSVRVLPSGDIEFLGRLDNQVKLHGFRIEPSEIEFVLGRHPAVRETVVLLSERDGGEKLLVAYFVAARGESPSGGELRRHLRESLPEYMIPSAFVMLNSLPLTPNGKLDKRALPSPVFSASDEGYVAPRTPEEEVLAGLWSKLLRVERVSVNDSFFDLGGHSLLATQAVSRVRETFGVELPLRSMFESPTVEGLAREVVARVRGGRADVAPPIRRGERVGPLPLSFAQQRLWFLDQLEPDSPFYNLTSAVRLKGPLDVSALERAFRELASRHESLRTTFKDVGGQPAQFIAPRGAAGLSLVDLRSLDTGLRDAEVVRLVREQARLPFDLTRGPLIRCTLLRLGDEESVLTIVMHHIISDGWSSGILMRELQTLYGAYVEGREASLEELPIQYADYASWQRDRLTADALESQLSYWRVQLAGATPALELPTDRPRPPVQTYSGSSHTLSLPADLTEALRRLARVHDSTLFMLLLAAFQSLLARYTGQGDICVGTPVAGRTSPELEGLIGFFVNTLVLRTELSDDPSFVELLGRVREACLGAYAHQDVPFEKLVEELRPQRDMSRQPLFQVMLAMQEWRGGELRLAGMDVEAIEGEGVTAKFDLTLSLREAGGGFDGWFEYNSDLFDAATIERMTGHFKRLLEGVVTDASARVSELPLMGEDERRLVLEVFNDTAREYPREATLHGLFEHQAARTPDAVAVEYEDERLTYAELNERADRVARSLRRMGVGTESRVGVLLERSINLVVGLLGVLKAGAAYVPLDPEYPHERLRFMLEDSGAGVLLTQSWLLDSAPDVGARVLCIDGSEAEVDAGGAPTQSRVVSANLAYVIYTSGSTGTPKGVAITHASACVLLQWAHETFAAEHLSRVLASTSVCFDLSVFELFVPLSCGGTVVLVRDALELAADGPARSVTLVNTVPSAMTELARVGGVPPSVRVVNLAGEALKRSVVEAAYEQGVEAVYNLYGPSEDTTYSTYTLVERGAEEQPTIGRPVANTRAYILDGHGRPVPVGVTGELHLGGEGLARGYLRRPGLTAEKFVPDPFGAEPGRRLYRTGDLARHLPDGRIEFLGRRDHQHKIRGFRIELGEIEAALAGHESVAQAVAMVREDDADDKRLVAYVVAEWNQEVGASELRERLRESLPEYMIPSAFVMLDSLPLTPNGKIDRKALPAPEITGSESHYVAPRTPVEELIAGVWSEVLGVERVGINDNFFDLGGHSLLLTRVASRLREAYAVELPLRALFESPTVESLARLLSGRQGVETESPPALKRVSRAEGGRAPLSFAQQRLWLLHRLDPESPAYNITIALRLRGPLDAYALGRALGEVAARQEVLRARFVEVEGEPWQVVEEAAPFALDVEEPSGVAAKAGREEWSRLAAEDEAQRPFDLEAGPVWRARLLRLSEDEHVLLLSMHHIVSDGWSLGVLIAEVGELYRGFSEGREARLKELPVQYADYAAWQREWLKGERLERQLAYWRERLAGVPRALNLPTDRDDGGKGKSVGATRMLTISAALSEELRALGRREGVTLYMLLMAAFQTMLHGLTGEEDIVVGTPITDRRRPETEPLIGFFVNTLALRADLSGNPTFREVLRRVRAAALEAYEHQDLPFEKLVEELRGSRGAARSPLFRVYFNMLNVDLRELRLPGLEVSLLESRAGAVKFDLELLVTDTGRELNAAVGYNSALFNDATIGRVAEQFRAVLEEVVAEPDRLISDIPAPAGAAEVIDDFNNDFNDSLEVNYD